MEGVGISISILGFVICACFFSFCVALSQIIKILERIAKALESKK